MITLWLWRMACIFWLVVFSPIRYCKRFDWYWNSWFSRHMFKVNRFGWITWEKQ